MSSLLAEFRFRANVFLTRQDAANLHELRKASSSVINTLSKYLAQLDEFEKKLDAMGKEQRVFKEVLPSGTEQLGLINIDINVANLDRYYSEAIGGMSEWSKRMRLVTNKNYAAAEFFIAQFSQLFEKKESIRRQKDRIHDDLNDAIDDLKKAQKQKKPLLITMYETALRAAQHNLANLNKEEIEIYLLPNIVAAKSYMEELRKPLNDTCNSLAAISTESSYEHIALRIRQVNELTQ